MARLLVVSRSMALAMRLADVHDVVEHPVEAIDDISLHGDIDAVVLDVGEPHAAIHALDRLRASGDTAPVLIVSGYQPAWASLVSVDLPDVVVVPLPITRAALLEGVSELTGRRPAPRSAGRSGASPTPVGWREPPTWTQSPAHPAATPATDRPPGWGELAAWAQPTSRPAALDRPDEDTEPDAAFSPEREPDPARAGGPAAESDAEAWQPPATASAPGAPEVAQQNEPPVEAQPEPEPETSAAATPLSPAEEADLEWLRLLAPPTATSSRSPGAGSDDLAAPFSFDDATGDEVDRVGDAVPDEVPADWWSGPSDDVQAGTPRANDNRDNGIREIPVRPPEPVLPPASEGRHDALVQPLLGPSAAADEVTAPAPPAPEPGAHRRRGSGGSIWVPWRRRSSPPEDDDAAGEPPTPWPSLSQGAGGEPLEASSLDDRPQPIDDPLVTEPPGTRPPDDDERFEAAVFTAAEEPRPFAPPVDWPSFTPPAAVASPPPLPPVLPPVHVDQQPPPLLQPPPLPVAEPAAVAHPQPPTAAAAAPPPPETQPSPPETKPPALPPRASVAPVLRLGSTDTRSLILPYGPPDAAGRGAEGSGDPDDWAAQNFDWWGPRPRAVPLDRLPASPAAADTTAADASSPEAVDEPDRSDPPDQSEPAEPTQPDRQGADPVDAAPATPADDVQQTPLASSPVESDGETAEPRSARDAQVVAPKVIAPTLEEPQAPTETAPAASVRPPMPVAEPVAEPLVERVATLSDDASTAADAEDTTGANVEAEAIAAQEPELEPAPEPEPDREGDEEPDEEPEAASPRIVRPSPVVPVAPAAGPDVDLRRDPPPSTSVPTVLLPVLGTVAATRTVPAPARTTRIGPSGHPLAPVVTTSLVSLVAQLTERSGDLYGVADTAQALADEIVERAEADAAAVLVPDGGVWRVSGGVGLRPLERRLVLDASHWLISEIAMGGRALLVEDADGLRPKLAGAPLAAWRHLLAVPVPGVRAAVVLARGYEAGQFGEPDLNAVVEPIRDGAALLQTALQIRHLARLLAPLREIDSSH